MRISMYDMYAEEKQTCIGFVCRSRNGLAGVRDEGMVYFLISFPRNNFAMQIQKCPVTCKMLMVIGIL